MTSPLPDAVWLNNIDICSIEQLAESSRLSIGEIEDLIQTGVIVPVDNRSQPQFFRLQYLVTLNAARRLRDDLQLDNHGIALALILLQRIESLQAELAAAYAKLPSRR